METILNNPVYRKDKYRWDEIEEMVTELIMYEEEDNRYPPIESEAISSINQFF
jgi:hypothetical protein